MPLYLVDAPASSRKQDIVICSRSGKRRRVLINGSQRTVSLMVFGIPQLKYACQCLNNPTLDSPKTFLQVPSSVS